jgi:hypothetical protein
VRLVNRTFRCAAVDILHMKYTWTVTCKHDEPERSVVMECDEIYATTLSSSPLSSLVDIRQIHQLHLMIPIRPQEKPGRSSINSLVRHISNSTALDHLRISAVLRYPHKCLGGGYWTKHENITQDIRSALSGLKALSGLHARIYLQADLPAQKAISYDTDISGYDAKEQLQGYAEELEACSKQKPVYRRSNRLQQEACF